MISILITAALLAQQVSAPVAVTTRVEGRVINTLNGEAVGKATVVLRAHDEEQRLSYATETDGNGNFSVDNVQPGAYAVSAERPGFDMQSTGATGAPPPEIKVESGQQVKDLQIRLMPLGVIIGRVLDADGDPVRGATVNALRYAYVNGKKQLRDVEQVESGDSGDFRLFGLRAGTFYLKATRSQRNSIANLPEAVATYYPSTIDQSHAAAVELRVGVQLQGFDIRLQPARAYTIHFELPEVDGFSNVQGMLLNDEGFVPVPGGGSQDSLFFGPVAPGPYDAVFTRGLGEEKPSYALKHVEVVNGDVDGGILTFLPGVDVTGAVRVEGGGFSGLAKLRINLQSKYRDLAIVINPDGSFLLKNAAPEIYEVTIGRVPGVYLKSMRMGDKQLADRRIDLVSKTEALTIVLGADVGEVEGSVRNIKGDPVARARVNTIAYGDHSSRTDLNRFAFTDEMGEFKIKDVPPGEYKVFAWQDVPVGAPQDPEFRKPFEKQAVPLRMPPNGHEKVSVTSIAPAPAERSSP
jgi:hypothetical protein